MATADSVKSKLQGLIDQANTATGDTDADLTTAVGRLIAGFGQGGGLIIGAKNMHDSSTDTANIYLNKGAEKPYSGWSATDYIPIKADTVYAVQNNDIVSAIKGEYSALYDSDKKYKNNFRGGFLNVQGGASMLIGDEGYIRFSAQTNVINNLSVFECTGSIKFDTDQSAVVTLSDDIPAEMALDILTGGGPAE